MELQLLNKILKNLQNPDHKLLTFIEKRVVKDLSEDEDGSQGESSEYYKYYKVNGVDNIFIEIQFGTDSYGYNDFPVGVQFVKPKEKVVTIFETI
jgi:hypothetical protein